MNLATLKRYSTEPSNPDQINKSGESQPPHHRGTEQLRSAQNESSGPDSCQCRITWSHAV